MMQPFDTSLLDQVLCDRRSHLEQARQELLRQTLDWLAQHGEEYGIRQAYVFGSVICPGRFTERSDVDIAVERIDSIRLLEAFTNMSSALGREVDMIELEKCHFADRIRQQGILWMSGSL